MSDLNDPRVLFAAERTLLAWSRTCLALMAFGFMIERFGLFLRILVPATERQPEHGLSVWIGLSLIISGGVLCILSNIQHRRFLASLKPIEIPDGYWLRLPLMVNSALMVLSLVLSAYMLYTVFGVDLKKW